MARYSGIGLMTAAVVHCGQATAITTARALTLNDAFVRHPQRFKGKIPMPPTIPDKVYINPPLTKDLISVEPQPAVAGSETA